MAQPQSQPQPSKAPLSKSARTRARILNAAAEVFREEGYGAPLSGIAERAGIQTGSLYYHFASREELVGEVLRLGVETSWGDVRAAVEALGDDASPLDRLAAAIRAHTMSVLKGSHFASALVRIGGQVPDAVAQIDRRARRKYGEYWQSLIEDARDAGQLAPGLDLFAARMLVLGSMNWAAEWFGRQRVVDADTVADTAVAMLLHGLSAISDAPPSR